MRSCNTCRGFLEKEIDSIEKEISARKKLDLPLIYKVVARNLDYRKLTGRNYNSPFARGAR